MLVNLCWHNPARAGHGHAGLAWIFLATQSLITTTSPSLFTFLSDKVADLSSAQPPITFSFLFVIDIINSKAPMKPCCLRSSLLVLIPHCIFLFFFHDYSQIVSDTEAWSKTEEITSNYNQIRPVWICNPTALSSNQFVVHSMVQIPKVIPEPTSF